MLTAYFSYKLYCKVQKVDGPQAALWLIPVMVYVGGLGVVVECFVYFLVWSAL